MQRAGDDTCKEGLWSGHGLGGRGHVAIDSASPGRAPVAAAGARRQSLRELSLPPFGRLQLLVQLRDPGHQLRHLLLAQPPPAAHAGHAKHSKGLTRAGTDQGREGHASRCKRKPTLRDGGTGDPGSAREGAQLMEDAMASAPWDDTCLRTGNPGSAREGAQRMEDAMESAPWDDPCLRTGTAGAPPVMQTPLPRRSLPLLAWPGQTPAWFGHNNRPAHGRGH